MLKWVQSGFATGNKTQGNARNLMGFKDGTMNPAGAEGPAWMNGGSYMVARRSAARPNSRRQISRPPTPTAITSFLKPPICASAPQQITTERSFYAGLNS